MGRGWRLAWPALAQDTKKPGGPTWPSGSAAVSAASQQVRDADRPRTMATGTPRRAPVALGRRMINTLRGLLLRHAAPAGTAGGA